MRHGRGGHGPAAGRKRNARPSLCEVLSSKKRGAIAQLGERVLCKHEVVGSIPSGSTRVSDTAAVRATALPMKYQFEDSRVFVRANARRRWLSSKEPVSAALRDGCPDGFCADRVSGKKLTS